MASEKRTEAGGIEKRRASKRGMKRTEVFTLYHVSKSKSLANKLKPIQPTALMSYSLRPLRRDSPPLKP